MTLIQVDKIKVGNRMRELDENKVDEIVASYESIGQINPISVDENYKLLAGHHRLACEENWLVTNRNKVIQGEGLKRQTNRN